MTGSMDNVLLSGHHFRGMQNGITIKVVIRPEIMRGFSKIKLFLYVRIAYYGRWEYIYVVERYYFS